MGRSVGYWYRRGRGVLVGEGRVALVTASYAIDKQNELMGFKIQRVESKRVDEFANMSDEELRQYVYGTNERRQLAGRQPRSEFTALKPVPAAA